MSEMGQTEKSSRPRGRSGLPPKPDIDRRAARCEMDCFALLAMTADGLWLISRCMRVLRCRQARTVSPAQSGRTISNMFSGLISK
jgi:hypothetical protein